jgi:hypothetical protein
MDLPRESGFLGGVESMFLLLLQKIAGAVAAAFMPKQLSPLFGNGHPGVTLY